MFFLRCENQYPDEEKNPMSDGLVTFCCLDQSSVFEANLKSKAFKKFGMTKRLIT
jgi:hypothetical protein